MNMDKIKQPFTIKSWLQTLRNEEQAAPTPDEDRVKEDRPKLSAQSKLLLLVHTLFLSAAALSGAFVQVYLWKERNDLAMIGWFGVIQQSFMALTFWLAGKWAKEGNTLHVLRCGLMTAALFYVLVLVLEQQAAHYYLLLGATQGLMSGFFWLAYNVVYFEVTGPEDRDRYNGWSGLLASSAGMLAPWIAGILIATLGGGVGYRMIFTLSLATFAAGFAASFLLKRRMPEGRYQWGFGYRLLTRPGSGWPRVMAAMVVQGLREGVFAFIIPLLVYISTRNELSLGRYALLTSGISLVSYYLMGQLLRRRYRRIVMLAGTLALGLSLLPFLSAMSYRSLLLFGVGTALFFPLYFVPATSVAFDRIGKEPDAAANRVEYVVLRELGINLGRVIGTCAFVITVSYTQAPAALQLFLFGIGITPLLVWLLLRPYLAYEPKSLKIKES